MALPERQASAVLTFEQFIPPHNIGVSYGERFMAEKALRIKPIGAGITYLHKYRLHEGMYSEKEVEQQKQVAKLTFATVVTHESAVAGVLNARFCWIHPEHRGRDVDLAAELWSEHSWRWGFVERFDYYKDNPVTLTKEAFKVAKRAYALLVLRGALVPGRAALGHSA